MESNDDGDDERWLFFCYFATGNRFWCWSSWILLNCEISYLITRHTDESMIGWLTIKWSLQMSSSSTTATRNTPKLMTDFKNPMNKFFNFMLMWYKFKTKKKLSQNTIKWNRKRLLNNKNNNKETKPYDRKKKQKQNKCEKCFEKECIFLECVYMCACDFFYRNCIAFYI